MAATLLPCYDPSCCDPTKPFLGFNSQVGFNPRECPQYYKYFVIFDWDKCLLACLNPIADSFSGGGLSLTSPNWGDAPCDAQGEIKNNVVDGHVVFEDNGDGTATCIEATGNYDGVIGQVYDACFIRSFVGFAFSYDTRGNDQILYGCGPDFPSECCPDITQNLIAFYMYND